MNIGEILLLVFVFVISGFLGVELISKVPSQLHTPLMSGTNAISGMTINVIGGYLVTDRMLGMFKKKGDDKK